MGVTPPIGRLLAVDRAPNEAEGDKVLYLLDGGRLGQDRLVRITLRPGGLKGFSFLPPEEVAKRTIQRPARRILAATEPGVGAPLGTPPPGGNVRTGHGPQSADR
ncbi:hypothetical protein HEP87_60155 [Streptomyces sp. S1D4-11]|nr:hypothetical protein [Streptomyces sp. S1D4-11]